MEGPALDLTDAESLCAFARFCDRDGQVWNQVTHTDDPEVRTPVRAAGEPVSVGAVGGLGSRHGAGARAGVAGVDRGQSRIRAERVQRPAVAARGHPGGVTADGFAYEVRNRVTLCRCGASKNKPFCDGSHAAIKFRDY